MAENDKTLEELLQAAGAADAELQRLLQQAGDGGSGAAAPPDAIPLELEGVSQWDLEQRRRRREKAAPPQAGSGRPPRAGKSGRAGRPSTRQGKSRPQLSEFLAPAAETSVPAQPDVATADLSLAPEMPANVNRRLPFGGTLPLTPAQAFLASELFGPPVAFRGPPTLPGLGGGLGARHYARALQETDRAGGARGPRAEVRETLAGREQETGNPHVGREHRDPQITEDAAPPAPPPAKSAAAPAPPAAPPAEIVAEPLPTPPASRESSPAKPAAIESLVPDRPAAVPPRDESWMVESAASEFPAEELTADALFRLAVREVFSDRKVSADESRFFKELRALLRLEPSCEQQIVAEEKERFRQLIPTLSKGTDLSAAALYERALELARRDRIVTESERTLLDRLGDLIGIPAARRRELEGSWQ